MMKLSTTMQCAEKSTMFRGIWRIDCLPLCSVRFFGAPLSAAATYLSAAATPTFLVHRSARANATYPLLTTLLRPHGLLLSRLLSHRNLVLQMYRQMTTTKISSMIVILLPTRPKLILHAGRRRRFACGQACCVGTMASMAILHFSSHPHYAFGHLGPDFEFKEVSLLLAVCTSFFFTVTSSH